MGKNQKQDESNREDRSLQRRDSRLDIPVAASGGLMPRDYGELLEFANMVAQSGMVPKSYEGNPGAVLVAVQMGSELGLTPMSAIRSICVINGMPSVWGDGMLALVVSHRDCEDVIETMELPEGDRIATCTVKRRGRAPVTRSFSWSDAQRAGLHEKRGPWQQYPQRMLQMRARSWALRDAFPDVLAGIRATEEAMDSSIDMGRPDYVEPTPGPEINPANTIPAAGRSSFGRKRPAPVPRETPSPAPDSYGSAGDERPPEQDHDYGPPPMGEGEAPEVTAEEAEAAGQQKLGGAGF